MVSESKRAVIVGAGPVGGLTAVHLAEQGWNVTVWSRSVTSITCNLFIGCTLCFVLPLCAVTISNPSTAVPS